MSPSLQNELQRAFAKGNPDEGMVVSSTKKIICFASSWRPGGRCVAGKEWIDGKPGDWVRPVNKEGSEALTDGDRQYRGGLRMVEVLDIADAPLLGKAPRSSSQTENWYLNPSGHWEFLGLAGWKDALRCVDP